MSDHLTSEFYRFIKSGKEPKPDMPLPRSPHEFEAILEWVPYMSEAQAKDFLTQTIKLVCTQQEMIKSLLKKQIGG